MSHTPQSYPVFPVSTKTSSSVLRSLFESETWHRFFVLFWFFCSLTVALCLQVELHRRVRSVPPAALTTECSAAYSTVSCHKAPLDIFVYMVISGVKLIFLFFRLNHSTVGVFSWRMGMCVCDDSLILPPSCLISLLTVLTTSPLVIWWTTPVCSAESLWCQQVPWEWRDR